MKVCFLHKPYDTYLLTRARYLIEKGHKVYSIYYKSKYSSNYSSIKWSGTVALGLSHDIFSKYLNRLLFPYIIAEFTKKHSIDIFHVQGMLNSFYLPFSNAKKRVITNQGSDVIITANSYPILKLGYRFFYCFVDAVVQDSIISQKNGIKLGAPKKNNKIIEVGVDFNLFNPDVEEGIARKWMGITTATKMVFSSRGYTDLYNLETYIQSIPIIVKIIKNIKFVFANNSPGFMKKYRPLICKLGIENHLILAGQMDHDKMMPYYTKDADVVVSVPSSDSSPASVYEAMACKTPVIISDLPWYRGKFEKNRDMVVVPVRDVEKLANAIIQVLIGEKAVDVDSAYETVFKNINYETENRKLELLYEKILSVS